MCGFPQHKISETSTSRLSIPADCQPPEIGRGVPCDRDLVSLIIWEVQER